MYFASRVQAGRMLASRLKEKYRYENCAVVALNDGGVMVGAQIAMQLHSILMLLDIDTILPHHDLETVFDITAKSANEYNHYHTDSELQELAGESFNYYIEEEKIHRMHDMNYLLGDSGTMSKDLLQDHYVILVTDGYKNGYGLNLAIEFLKTIRVAGIVIAAPLASVSAVDIMHILADDLYCLNVLENYTTTNHYYHQQDIPNHELILRTLSEIILKWK